MLLLRLVSQKSLILCELYLLLLLLLHLLLLGQLVMRQRRLRTAGAVDAILQSGLQHSDANLLLGAARLLCGESRFSCSAECCLAAAARACPSAVRCSAAAS